MKMRWLGLALGIGAALGALTPLKDKPSLPSGQYEALQRMIVYEQLLVTSCGAHAQGSKYYALVTPPMGAYITNHVPADQRTFYLACSERIVCGLQDTQYSAREYWKRLRTPDGLEALVAAVVKDRDRLVAVR